MILRAPTLRRACVTSSQPLAQPLVSAYLPLMRPGHLPRALALSLALSAAPALADDGRARDLAEQLESPFCPGRTISSCTSPAAAKWRNDIETWVAEGVPSEEIKARLEARAGRDLSFVPTSDGFYGLLAFGAVASLGAIALITRRVRCRDERELEQEPPPSPRADDAELDARLDAELAFED